ncbi:LysR family transcriptional regulator [Rhizobium laguerreae]|uniref:LysR family transcriptional regulator n=1 Tax=Rhizobium laguerreae TaxID=1076926 RepID=A0A6N9ZG64_9HYPH|nr:LysR family transcriptional regulator [Rhizobium laguerreae]NEH92477.1 LysR family transcriptional regulator [Rhizobium laguerreae]
MLDGVSLDQLRAFIASVDEGSFSAAARKLRRAQSVVSDLISGLEAQMVVQLFDRSARYPTLTPAGIALLADARSIISGVDFMKARAKGMSSGLEPELSVVVDVHFPIAAITTAANEFKSLFPNTPLRLFVEALGATHQRVLDGTATVGVAASLPNAPSSLGGEALAGVTIVMVAARHHPLASIKGTIPRSELAKHVQLVLTDRSSISDGVEFGVMSSLTWRLADLFAKHAFLLNGLGWGGMPVHAIRRNIAEGELVELSIQDAPAGGFIVPMSAIYRTSAPPGPAGRWFIDRLNRCSGTAPTVD